MRRKHNAVAPGTKQHPKEDAPETALTQTNSMGLAQQADRLGKAAQGTGHSTTCVKDQSTGPRESGILRRRIHWNNSGPAR